MQAPCRIDEHQIRTRLLSALERFIAHACRIAPALARNDLNIGSARPFFELFDGCRPERIGATKQHLAIVAMGLSGDLAHRGGLA